MRPPHLLPCFAALLFLAGCPPKTPLVGPPPPPPIETVTVDAKDERPDVGSLVVGLARPSGKFDPAGLDGTGIERWFANMPTLVTLGDSVKYDGKFPGEKGNWSKWDDGVRQLFKKHATRPGGVQWEVWNEPDKSSFKGSQADFFAVYVRTAKILRSLNAEAVLVGPSTSSNGWVQEFLKVAKEFDVPPNIVCWHEGANKPDVAGHVNGVEESFWQDGTGHEHVRIMQTTSSARAFVPGDVVILMAGIREARRQNMWRGLREELAIKAHHLLADDKSPRAILRAMSLVAGVRGKPVKVDRADTIHGVAGRWADGKTLEIVLGRAGAKSLKDPAPPEAQLRVKNLPRGEAHIAVTKLPNTGAAPAADPVLIFQHDVPVHNGEIKCPLAGFERGEVLSIKIEIRPAPATGAP
ncbi:MAG TPA: hypothetical protein VEA69_24950 [Tepidisphaeraceae bacterium]|nr:hypothetical protein [Tepidisphaeraceae bacterium]